MSEPLNEITEINATVDDLTSTDSLVGAIFPSIAATIDVTESNITETLRVGATGPRGPQGEVGSGITFKGELANPTLLPSSENNQGDAYLIETGGTYLGITYQDADLVIWDGIEWVSGGSIKGPAGESSGIISKNGSIVNSVIRSTLNFIEGTGITLTIEDDPINDEVDITITGSSASPWFY